MVWTPLQMPTIAHIGAFINTDTIPHHTNKDPSTGKYETIDTELHIGPYRHDNNKVIPLVGVDYISPR